MSLPASVPGVFTLEVVRGAKADPGRAPDLAVELPHGATRTADYRALRGRLVGAYDDDLVDFFHVNTDIGSPELAVATAQALVAAAPTRSVAILRSHIPRTYVDCNRVIDAAPEAFKEGKVTPGVPPWVRDPADLALLHDLHAVYVEGACALVDTVCGAGGAALFLHTYAPRSVEVEVDADIVANLRAAYLPENVERWVLRPEVDVIGRTLAGELKLDERVLADLVAGYREVGVDVADGRTYPLHPSTWGYQHSERWPGRTLCVEIRRDLVADPWDPFVEMRIGAAKVARMAGPLATTIARWLAR
ncbi:MAG: hypothetical protein ACK4YP_28615 [Myxococcota bacterium]